MEEAAANVIQGAFAQDERASFDSVCERVPGACLESQTGAGLGCHGRYRPQGRR